MSDWNLKDYVHQLYKRRWLVATFFAATVVLVSLWTLQQSKVYSAATTVEIGAETPDAAFFQDVVNTSPYGWWSAMRYYETQYQIIRSRDMLSRAAVKAIAQGILANGQVEQVTTYLQGGLSIKADDSSRLAQIVFEDNDPKRAQALSILIAETYVEENLGRKLRGVDEAISWLNARLKEIRAEKNLQEAELQEKRKEHRILSMSNEGELVQNTLRSLTENLNRLKNERLEIQAKYFKLRDLVQSSEKVEDLFGVVNNDILQRLKIELTTLKSEQSQLSTKYLEKHPEVLRVQSQMDELNKLIKQEVNNEVNRLKTRYLLSKAEEESIAKALEDAKLKALEIEEISQDLADVALLSSTNREIYETLLKRIKEADLSALVRSNNIRVLDRALFPHRPIRPNVLKNILMALVVGLLGGITLAFVVEYIDDTVQTVDDVERFVKLAVLGVIPKALATEGQERTLKVISSDVLKKESARDIAFLPHTEPQSVVAEFYRTLRTNLLFLTRKEQGSRVLFVSTAPSEGKTVTVINLAVTLAQLGKRVVILELDFRKPRMAKAIGVKEHKGITNVLLGELKLEEAIFKEQRTQVHFLLAGSIPPNPSELLSSDDLAQMVQHLSSHYDYVFMDSSPVAPVADATIASELADKVMLIVRAGKTNRKAIIMAAKQLRAVKANLVGAILNDVDLQSSYSSYHYYQYHYKADPDEKELQDKELSQA